MATFICASALAGSYKARLHRLQHVTGALSIDAASKAATQIVMQGAVTTAEQVDSERGRVGGKIHPNDMADTELACQANKIRERVSLEIFGPKGQG